MAAAMRAWRALSGSHDRSEEAGPSSLGLARRKASTPYPQRTCHFCNESSLIVPPHPEAADGASAGQAQGNMSTAPSSYVSTGTPDRWYCIHCMCWNTTDVHEVGGIATWEPAMADERLNEKPARYNTRSASKLLTQTRSTFCHTCQTNQTLLLSLIANHDEGNTTDAQTDNDAWLEDLQERYPPVCSTCQERVDERIQDADSKARKLIWAGLLQQRARKERGGQDSQPASPIKTGVVGSVPSVSAESKWSVAWWQIQRLCFVAKWLLDISALVLRVRDGGRNGDDRILYCFGAALLLNSTLMDWDPTRRRRDRLLRELSSSKFIQTDSLHRWAMVQHTFYCLRLAYLPAFYKVHDYSVGLAISSALLVADACLSWWAYPTVRILKAPRVSLQSRRLKGRVRALGDVAASPRHTAHCVDQALNCLTLQQERQYNQHTLKQDMLGALQSGEADSTVILHEDDDDDTNPDDSMDWTPTPAGDASATAKSSTAWNFGPQRMFGPQRQTGLEDLVSTRLGLNDSQEVVVSGIGTTDTSKNRVLGRSNIVHLASMLALAAIAVILHTYVPRDGVTAKSPWRAVQNAAGQWQERFAHAQDDNGREQTMWGSAARVRHAQP